MPQIICYDNYGKSVTRLTQWDINRTLKLLNWEYNVSPTIQFTNRSQTVNYTVKSSLQDNTVCFDVPNKLLQGTDTILAFIGVPRNLTDKELFFGNELPSVSEGDENKDYYIGSDDDGYTLYSFDSTNLNYNISKTDITKTQAQITLEYEASSFEWKTVFKVEFPIVRRTKPSDYEYVDNADIISLASLYDEFLKGMDEIREVEERIGDSMFRATYWFDNETIRCDKTFAVIKDAYENNQIIKAAFSDDDTLVWEADIVSATANIITYCGIVNNNVIYIAHTSDNTIHFQNSPIPFSFIIEYINNNNEWTTTTSAMAIREAIADGKTIIADLQGWQNSTHNYLPLTGLSDNGNTFTFSAVGMNADAVLIHKSNGDIILTEKSGSATYEPMVFTNVSPVFTDQSSNPDTGYEDYTYRGVISNLEGITSDMFATVIFSETQALSGNYAVTCVTGMKTVTIYSNDNTPIVIPGIIIGFPTEAQFNDAEIEEAMNEIIGGVE